MRSSLTLLLSILFLNSNSQAPAGAAPAAPAPPPAATQPTSDYKDKTFIFDFYHSITECDEVGQNRGASVIAPKGATFTVAAVTATDIVIEFQQWNKSTPEYDNFNYGPAIRVTQQLAPIPNDDVAVRLAAGTDGFKFFVLTKTEFAAVCSEYKYENPWSGDFGTLTTPFRFRTAPTQFTSNFSLGASFCIKYKVSSNFSLGGVVGLSLTNVTLDSISTGGFVKQKTERPAVTPSINSRTNFQENYS